MGFPSFMNDAEQISAVDNVAALDDVDRLFSIGTSDLTISTLNPFQYTMADEYTVIWLCMSTVLTYGLDMGLQGDLAKSWDTSDDGLTWTIEIVDNAYFCDPTDPTVEDPTRLVTVDDIIYTYWAVQNFKSNLHFYLPGGPADGTDPTIASMTADGYFKMTIVLDHSFAPFLAALTTIPIIPKYYWEPQESGSGDPTGWTQALPIGSGAFYYGLDGLPTAGEAPLLRNPCWFQEKNRGWQIHVDTLKLKDMTDSSTAWSNLKIGEIDCMIGVQPSTYTEELPTLDDVIGFAQSTGFVYEFNLNQLTPEKRDELGWYQGGAYNNQILLDPEVKMAMAMCVNKTFFVEDVLMGLGSYADSLIPDINPWYHRYENPVSFDTAAARQMLMADGWNMDLAGNPASADQTPLYGMFDGELQPLEFRFVTLNDPIEWQQGAQYMVEWCAEAGVKLNLELVAPNQMNTIWYYGDYDTWLWDWIFTPFSEPSTDILSVLTTDEIGSWSDVFMSEPVFDALYNASVREMDPVARRVILDEMQDFAYEDFSCQCVAYRKELYAVSTLNWGNFGDWEEDFILMPDQGFPYLYMMISPIGENAVPQNQAPVIASLDEEFQGYMGEAIDFNGLATDGAGEILEYQWYWGDGETSGWLTSGTTTHTYAEDGYYTVYFAARESNDLTTADYYITWAKTVAKVIDASNTAPHSLGISYDPLVFDTGDVVTFTGSAVDDDGDEIDYSWTFGDMYSAKGQVVEHQYLVPGSYTVTLYANDSRVGLDPRPVMTNTLVVVGGNQAPTIDVPDFPDVITDVSYDFSVTASDPESDPIRYTWEWGDGTMTVTDVDSASHTYDVQDIYELTVYADDQTGVGGHNVSDTGVVTVMSVDNVAPVIVSFVADETTVYTGGDVTFTAVATDADGDPMRFTFAFGDDSFAVEESEATAPDEQVTFTVTHTYESSGTMTARVYVWDMQDNTTSSDVTITVELNSAPLVPVLTDLTVRANETVTFTTEPLDPDGDDMTIWWDFGDDSPMEPGATVTHEYVMPDEYAYRVWVDDGHDHNETRAAVITVLSEFENFAPEVEALENMTALVGEAVVFNATATDVNEDVLTYTWDFGDGSGLSVGQEVHHVYSAADEYTFMVYVSDGEFNESADAVVNVSASAPPVADAGDDQAVDVGAEVSFDGSGSTDDMLVVNYTWTFSYDGGTETLYGEAPEFTFEVAGEYNVTLTVKDFEGQTDADYVTITVDDGKSFIQEYGLWIALLAAIVVVAVVVMVLKGRKGGKAPETAVEGIEET